MSHSPTNHSVNYFASRGEENILVIGNCFEMRETRDTSDHCLPVRVGWTDPNIDNIDNNTNSVIRVIFEFVSSLKG